MKNITITKKQYAYLLKNERKLEILENDGVDNWEWYMEGKTEEDCYILDSASVDEVIEKLGWEYKQHD